MKRQPKKRVSLKKVLAQITAERDAAVQKEREAGKIVEMHIERVRTLEHERNNLRRTQLLARLNMADFHNLLASLGTIRSALEEARVRLGNIENLFKEPEPVVPKAFQKS